VPGPQFTLYLLGRRLLVLYPVVPLAQRQTLGIAVMSYDGQLGFGLLGDYDALPELEAIAQDVRRAIASLARVAGAPTPNSRPRGSRNSSPASAQRAARARKGSRAGAAGRASPNGTPAGKPAAAT
jgi:hypothetical protein